MIGAAFNKIAGHGMRDFISNNWRMLTEISDGPTITPPIPRSKAKRAQRMLSIATPAEFGESSTDKRHSIFIGTPPNNSPSMRKKQSYYLFAKAHNPMGQHAHCHHPYRDALRKSPLRFLRFFSMPNVYDQDI